jgi:hypothetical protein
MNDLLHGKISGSVALKKGLLSLVTGDEGSAKFDKALVISARRSPKASLRPP